MAMYIEFFLEIIADFVHINVDEDSDYWRDRAWYYYYHRFLGRNTAPDTEIIL